MALKVKKRKRQKTSLAMYAMLAPYVILLIVFGLIPVIMAINEVPSESRSNRDGGWDTFYLVFHDFRFADAVKHVGQFMLIFVPLTLVFVIGMALMLDIKSSKWKKYLRLSYIVPAAVSGAVAVLVWYILLAPTMSPFKVPLSWFGIKTADQIWRTENLPVLLALIAFFSVAGNWILIQYGSLQSISAEVIEAARMDGCSAFQLATKIKLPLIKKYVIYMAVLVFAGGLQLFVEPQLLNTGVYQGIAETWSPDQLAYELAFTYGDFGSASALSIMLLIPSLIGALIVIFKTDMFDDAQVEKQQKVETQS